MRESFWRKAAGLSVSFLLVFLIFSVLVSASAVKLDTGAPSDASVFVGDTLFFSHVTLMIKGTEVLPADHLVFSIYDRSSHQEVAHVIFSLVGTEISDTPHGAFTVVNVTDTSTLPYQHGGRHCGYGYGYGYGSIELTILYNITYMTHQPGEFYAKLFVDSAQHTYTSGRSQSFTVLPAPGFPKMISVDILPGRWPNLLRIRNHGRFTVAICGTKSFDVHTIDPQSIRLSLNGGKKHIKPLSICYRDVATPGDQNRSGDGFIDLTLKFINPQVVHVFNLFKHQGETFKFTITGTLKTTFLPVEGHDFVKILTGFKDKRQ